MSVKNDSPICNKKSTPPTKQKVRNPFDKVLIERLHKPLCSPGMCKIYKKQKNGSFRWDIDQTCKLLPADIVACSSQFEPSPDPVLEKIAEEANEKFFSQQLVVPSPLELSKKTKPFLSSSDSSSNLLTSLVSDKPVLRDVSAQTVATIPPELPPNIEAILQPFCTYTQDQNISGDYEITANGSLRRQLFFEEHSDMEHDDSEQTDDEIHTEIRPPSSFETHTHVKFSPDLSCDLVSKGLKRTFGTPLQKGIGTSCYRNKILDVVDFAEPCFSPIDFRTPKRNQISATSSSLASISISPVTKTASSDEEKNNFTSPETETMATCLDCVVPLSDSKLRAKCFCKNAPNKSLIKRSTSLKDSPRRSRDRRGSFSDKRSQSMSSLNRSRSVQKLDFSMDMSVDGSLHNTSQADSEGSPKPIRATWSIEEDTSIQKLVKSELLQAKSHEIQSSTHIISVNNLLDETPIKGKQKTSVLLHEISKIRAPLRLSPMHMSLDSSLDNFDIPLCMEEKKIDFNNIDLEFLTDVSEIERNTNGTEDSSTCFQRVDSVFNENTFYGNTSNYYQSAIKPSELTVTNPKINTTALKEITNVNWMRVDSGFKDETSNDSMQFYFNDSSNKKACRFSEAKLPGQEQVEEFKKFLIQTPSNNEAISMSDIFADDMTFKCNFSSTPSKNKTHNVNN